MDIFGVCLTFWAPRFRISSHDFLRGNAAKVKNFQLLIDFEQVWDVAIFEFSVH